MRDVAAFGVAFAVALAGCGGSSSTASRSRVATASPVAAGVGYRGKVGDGSGSGCAAARLRSVVRGGKRVLTFVDRSRTVQYPGKAPVPRSLVTIVRYPAAGAPGGGEIASARPLRSAGSYPLVIFGHGFAVTPTIYAPLLRAWARAGYVVAAPIFPAGNADAPGGPNESDLVNQPADMSFVITQMLAESAARPARSRG